MSEESDEAQSAIRMTSAASNDISYEKISINKACNIIGGEKIENQRRSSKKISKASKQSGGGIEMAKLVAENNAKAEGDTWRNHRKARRKINRSAKKRHQ